MKNTTKLLSGLFAVAIVTVTFASTSVFAYQGDSSVQGPDYSPERHEAMTEAFETNNYEAWVSLMGDKGRVTELINADNFSTFVEAHNLANEGNIEESKALMAELGLGLKDGSGQGSQMKRSGQGNKSGLKNGSGQRANNN